MRMERQRMKMGFANIKGEKLGDLNDIKIEFDRSYSQY